MPLIKSIILAIAFVLPLTSYANVRFSGFGNLGMVTSDSDTLAYRNNMSQSYGKFNGDIDVRTNTKLGLQLEWQSKGQFDAVFQTLLQENDTDKATDYVRLAFLRYKPSADISIRVGRLPLDTFLITEYREVDFAYPWAKAPNEVYGTIPFYFVDGFDMSYTKPFENFSLISKLFAGQSSAHVGDFGQVELEKLMGLTFELQSYNWMVSTKFSRGMFKESPGSTERLIAGLNSLDLLWPTVASYSNQFDLTNVAADYLSLGGRYDFNDFTFYAELTEVHSDSISIADLSSGYFSVAYRFDNFQLFSSIGYTKSRRYQFNELNKAGIETDQLPIQTQYLIQQLGQGAEQAANYYASNQQSYSLGGRWDLSDNFALKIQLDRTNIDEAGETLWLIKPNSTIDGSNTINTLFINLSFVF